MGASSQTPHFNGTLFFNPLISKRFNDKEIQTGFDEILAGLNHSYIWRKALYGEPGTYAGTSISTAYLAGKIADYLRKHPGTKTINAAELMNAD